MIPVTTILKNISRQAKEEIEMPKIRCPKCKKLVIKSEFENKGCYICNFKPENGIK